MTTKTIQASTHTVFPLAEVKAAHESDHRIARLAARKAFREAWQAEHRPWPPPQCFARHLYAVPSRFSRRNPVCRPPAPNISRSRHKSTISRIGLFSSNSPSAKLSIESTSAATSTYQTSTTASSTCSTTPRRAPTGLIAGLSTTGLMKIQPPTTIFRRNITSAIFSQPHYTVNHIIFSTPLYMNRLARFAKAPNLTNYMLF